MDHLVEERSGSPKYCRVHIKDMTALRSGVYTNGDSWQDRGGQLFGGEGDREPKRKPAGRKEGDGVRRSSVHILRSGSEKLGRGVGVQSHGVSVPSPHGGFVHVGCTLERADRLATGHINPRFCVTCSYE